MKRPTKIRDLRRGSGSPPPSTSVFARFPLWQGGGRGGDHVHGHGGGSSGDNAANGGGSFGSDVDGKADPGAQSPSWDVGEQIPGFRIPVGA